MAFGKNVRGQEKSAIWTVVPINLGGAQKKSDLQDHIGEGKRQEGFKRHSLISH